ncbi:MAG: ABC transporter permease [Clostridia bacterium]|nr:ABC transporter permease [Clostridia bacterium]
MLLKKMLRTLWRYKAQFLSMVLMIALGVGVFLGFNMEWYSLRIDTDDIYARTGFADFRVYSEKGFSADDLEAVLAIDGVRDATRFLSVNTTVQGDTDVIALTVSENMNVSGLLVMEGEPYDAQSADGIWLSDSYANKNGVSIGDSLTLSYKMLSVTGTVKGLIKASEYLICVPDETQLMPDYSSYGYAYISPVMLEKVVPVLFRGLIGNSLYFQINVLSELSKADFVRAANEALGKTWLVLSKDETISWAEAQGEIEEGITMGSILPVLFLAIAILTMVTTMHRITASEKTQIGALKALGFRDRRILLHYTCYALFIGLIGSALGVAIGYGLCYFIMNPNGAMGTYIDMPRWDLYVPGFCWYALVGINVFLTVIGYLSVKRMLKGTAADALRPYTPRRMKHLRLEETRAFKALDFGTKWNLRDCFRHLSRSLTTLFGILGCMVLLVGGLGMMDTMNAFVTTFYEDAIRYTNRINLDSESVTNAQALALAERYQGDWCAQSSVQIVDKGYGLEIYSISHDQVRFADEDMRYIPLGDDGAYISSRIAKAFGLSAGDTLTFSPYGSDRSYTVTVSGILRSLSESVVMTKDYAEKADIPYTINTVFTDATEIEPDSHILNVQSKQAIMDSFDSFLELMNVMIFLLVAAAVILGIVVLYNLGVMSYIERYREMATLKVIGFRDRRIARLLISQNLWLTIVGILLGLPAGVGVLQYLLDALASEYELKLTLGPATYLISVLLTFLTSLLVGLMVARKNRSIDMVAALKTEE